MQSRGLADSLPRLALPLALPTDPRALAAAMTQPRADDDYDYLFKGTDAPDTSSQTAAPS